MAAAALTCSAMHTRRWLRLFLGAGLVALQCATPLLGNGGGYVKGLASSGAFKPLNIEQVQMLSEKLEIDLHIEHAEIRIEYVLHNPGSKVTVEAGFPSAVPADPYGEVDAGPMTMKQL